MKKPGRVSIVIATMAAAMIAAIPVSRAAAQPAAQTASTATTLPAYDAALALYQRGRQLDFEGKTAEAAARYQTALDAAEKALVSASTDMDLMALKCWSLFRLGRHQEVLRAGSAALKVRQDFRILETMGESSYHLGRNEDAIAQLSAYIELAPVSDDRMSSAYFYLGETYLRMKYYEHADIAFSTAVHLAPAMTRWWYRLGVTLEEMGQYKRAWEAYGKALAGNPNYADAAAARSRIKAKTGL